MSRRRAAPRTDDKRPPLGRLRTLVLEPARARSGRMMKRIRTELDDTREPGPWITAARTLAAEGVISADAVYYFVEILLECSTLHAAAHDGEMLRLEHEMDQVKRAHGLRDDAAHARPRRRRGPARARSGRVPESGSLGALRRVGIRRYGVGPVCGPLDTEGRPSDWSRIGPMTAR